MRTNNILGLVYANVHDDLVPELTTLRSMGSLPFAGRYRLIDFSLSNLVNAGISQVGIITKQNYQSLMDHVGGGKAFDLDRKNGGLFILPPFSTASSGEIYKGHLDALAGIMPFLLRAKQEYVVLCDSDVVSNVDISDMFNRHIESGADFTVAYKRGKLPKNHEDIMTFDFDADTRVTAISFPKASESADYSLDITITKREFLIDLVNEMTEKGFTSISRHLLAGGVERFKIFGYKVEGFAEVVDSPKTYFSLNMKLLESKIRKSLFNKERPVYTKTHDCMPTRYGLISDVKKSLIAEGCLIEGTVKNSIVFRNVTVEEGAVVENAILMQGAVVKKGAKVDHTVMDKLSVVGEGVNVEGTKQNIRYIGKREKIGE